MKKSLSQAIALATLVGSAGIANAAVKVNHEGIGGALLYPLYTVNEGNTSLVSVVNTTDKFKAVKVRFVEAKNSAEVLDFHLYLSPKDVWSGTIVPTADGAKLVSNDRSCIAGITANDGTFPKDGLPFRTEQITMDEMRLAAKDKSSAAEKAARVRVGHFEAIEMGEVAAEYIPPHQRGKLQPISLGKAIKHEDGVPGGCGVVTTWWETDLKMAGKQKDRDNRISHVATGENITGEIAIKAPKGGLYGTGGVVNVKAGWAASYDAVALLDDALTGTAFYKYAQHPRPGSIYPHLGTVVLGAKDFAAVETGAATEVDPEATPITSVQTYIVPGDERLNQVTDALAVSELYNDYYVEPALDAGTELVVTFPTKRFYTFETVDADDSGLRYIYTDGNHDYKGGVADGTYAVNGITTADEIEGAGWAKGVAGKATSALDTGSAFETRWAFETSTAAVTFKSPTLYGKDEQEITATDGFISPRPLVEGTIDLNYEANVIALNNSNALGTKGLVSVNVDTPFMEGWLELNRESAGDKVPAVGFGVITTKNGVSADGALRNFAQTFKHKTVK